MKIILTIEIPTAALENEGVTASEVIAQFEANAAELREEMTHGASITMEVVA